MSDFDVWPVLAHYGWELPAPKGVWQTVKCHAHDDSHGSCRISSDANYVKCLACEFHGDAIAVVQHYEGVDFKNAVRRCEEITGGSNNLIQPSSISRSRLPHRTRDQQRKRKYVPPRLRQRTDDRA